MIYIVQVLDFPLLMEDGGAILEQDMHVRTMFGSQCSFAVTLYPSCSEPLFNAVVPVQAFLHSQCWKGADDCGADIQSSEESDN